MKLYFAGDGYVDVIAKSNNKILLSYGSSDIKKWFNITSEKLFLDSGAFSCYTRGKTVDIDKYAEFIKNNKSKLSVYANLDVIGSPKATQKNQKYLEHLGLQPLPTFHYGSDKKYLLSMVSKYSYIALGGLVPLALQRARLCAWLSYCFSIIKNKSRVHAFGVNSGYLWEKYPFYSVDATSYIRAMKFRRMMDVDGVYHDKQTKTILGLKLNTYHYKKLVKESMSIYQRLADDVTKLWEARGVAWND